MNKILICKRLKNPKPPLNQGGQNQLTATVLKLTTSNHITRGKYEARNKSKSKKFWSKQTDLRKNRCARYPPWLLWCERVLKGECWRKEFRGGERVGSASICGAPVSALLLQAQWQLTRRRGSVLVTGCLNPRHSSRHACIMTASTVGMLTCVCARARAHAHTCVYTHECTCEN